MKAEVSKDITVEELKTLNKTLGMTVEINDGQITAVNFEEVAK